jgi:hypothetical protein
MWAPAMMTQGALDVAVEVEHVVTVLTLPVGCITSKYLASRFVQKAYAPKVLYLIGTPLKMAVSPARSVVGGF